MTPTPRLARLLLATLLLTPVAAAQTHPDFTPNESSLPAEGISIPMVLVHGIPMVKGTINGEGPFRFVIDSGAPGLVVSQAIADRLELPGPPGMPAGVKIVANSGPGSPGVPATLAQVDTLRLGDATFNGLFTVALDFPGSGAFDGIVGMAVVKEYLMTLDYPTGRLGLTHGTLEAESPGVLAYTMPRQKDSHPVIDLQLNGTTREFTMDTGMSGALRMPPSFIEDEPLGYGPVAGPRARTVDTAERKHLARLDGTLRVGPHSIANPVFEADDAERHAMIGSGVFRHFAITFDQDDMRVRFKHDGKGPIATPAKRVLGFDLEQQDDGRLLVGDVVEGSPAATAGLEVGMEVVSVDGQPIATVHGAPAWGKLVEQDRLSVVIRADGGGTREITIPVYELIPAA